jgi:benzoate-CoA ligase
MIKVGGLWVAPADVEACLIRHPAVSEAAVIGVTSRTSAASRPSSSALRSPPSPTPWPTSCAQWCKEHLRRYEYPHVVEFVEDFPRTVDGQDPALQAPRGRGEAPSAG